MKNFLYFLPRAFAILMAGFTAIFILEGFSPGFGLGDAISHLVLALLVVAATVVAWKWPKYGGWIFLLIGVRIALPVLWGNLQPLIIGGVPILVGILFLREGFMQKKTLKSSAEVGKS